MQLMNYLITMSLFISFFVIVALSHPIYASDPTTSKLFLEPKKRFTLPSKPLNTNRRRPHSHKKKGPKLLPYRSENLLRKILLSPSQHTKIDTINKTFRASFDSLNKKIDLKKKRISMLLKMSYLPSVDVDPLIKSYYALKADHLIVYFKYSAEIRKILTAEQLDSFPRLRDRQF